MVDGILYILTVDSFTFIHGLPIPSQKPNQCSQYDTGVASYSIFQGPFVLITNLWAIPFFILNFA